MRSVAILVILLPCHFLYLSDSAEGLDSRRFSWRQWCGGAGVGEQGGWNTMEGI